MIFKQTLILLFIFLLDRKFQIAWESSKPMKNVIKQHFLLVTNWEECETMFCVDSPFPL